MRIETDSSIFLGQQIVDGIRSVVGPNIASHWAVRRPDLDNLIYGGIHLTKSEAEEAKRKLVDQNKESLSDALATLLVGWRIPNREAREFNKNSEIIELKVGEEYLPWGNGGISLEHGLDDNTHQNNK